MIERFGFIDFETGLVYRFVEIASERQCRDENTGIEC